MSDDDQTSEGHDCERCANDGMVCCAIARTGWPDAGQRCAAYVPDYWARETEDDKPRR